MREFSASQKAVRITLLLAFATALLAVLKIIFGITGHSHALIADGIHSASDLLIDILILFAAHYAHQKADHNHPYGHGRIETAGTLGLSVILFFAGAGIIINAGEHLWGHQPIQVPNTYVLIIAALSIVINEILFHFTMRVANQINSTLLRANAWHCRSDVAASAVVLIGVAGARFGYPHLDAVAAVLVGLMVIKLGAELGWSSICELVDTGVDDATLEEIKNSINHVPGVQTLHQLRTRTINNAIFVDVHILVAPHLSVSEGHFIGEQVRTHLLNEISGVADVTVHVDPEDDEIAESSIALPARSELLTLLEQRWQPLFQSISGDAITLHYLSGKIYVELRIPMSVVSNQETAEKLVQQLRAAVKDVTQIAQVEVLFY